ncbi:DUF4864 domain-containing protein [uncultured Pelagimonas sp.]|uniref:DUF4864 domain-containing protein n=1 Tax=uncultured Pelagimonas sp. TaxID=1618102 RepID=UPI0026308EAF|nr:DUF4864 domain-containing protein [uncultured Pelagimonas sp.]
MRSLIFALTLMGIGGVAVGQDAQARNPSIENTIEQQIEAFQVNDFAKAFEYASPTIQGLFGTSENFGAMVQNGYPMVWRPKDLRFGELRQIEGNLWQQVIVIDQAGQVFALDYMMVEVKGDWRIAAVQMIPPPEVAV